MFVCVFLRKRKLLQYSFHFVSLERGTNNSRRRTNQHRFGCGSLNGKTVFLPADLLPYTRISPTVVFTEFSSGNTGKWILASFYVSFLQNFFCTLLHHIHFELFAKLALGIYIGFLSVFNCTHFHFKLQQKFYKSEYLIQGTHAYGKCNLKKKLCSSRQIKKFSNSILNQHLSRGLTFSL